MILTSRATTSSCRGITYRRVLVCLYAASPVRALLQLLRLYNMQAHTSGKVLHLLVLLGAINPTRRRSESWNVRGGQV